MALADRTAQAVPAGRRAQVARAGRKAPESQDARKAAGVPNARKARVGLTGLVRTVRKVQAAPGVRTEPVRLGHKVDLDARMVRGRIVRKMRADRRAPTVRVRTVRLAVALRVRRRLAGQVVSRVDRKPVDPTIGRLVLPAEIPGAATPDRVGTPVPGAHMAVNPAPVARRVGSHLVDARRADSRSAAARKVGSRLVTARKADSRSAVARKADSRPVGVHSTENPRRAAARSVAESASEARSDW